MNTDQLIKSIKLNGSVPESDQFSDEAILSLADEVLEETILPRILKTKEEYFVFTQLVPISANKGKYRIPSRALNGVMRDIQIVNGTNVKSLDYVNPETLTSTAPGVSNSFYLESNSIMLYPTPASVGSTLLLRYFIKPGKLIPLNQAGEVIGIDLNTNTVTLASVPTSFTNGARLDMVKGSADYEVLSLTHSITSVSNSDLTLSSIPEDLEVGDYLTPSGYSPFPNIPDCFHAALALFTAAKCLGSMGQIDQQGAMLQRAEEALRLNLEVITPRVQGEPQKITSILI